MTKGKTTLIQKAPFKRTAPNNYRPKSRLPMMWKILTAQREEIYYLLTRRGLIPEEQNGCCKRSRSKGELYYIDQRTLNEGKNGQKNLAIDWIDNKKGYDIVLRTYIRNCYKMYKISDEVIKSIQKSRKVELTTGGGCLYEANIQIGIFLGHALSLLLFIITRMPLNHILRNCTAGYQHIKLHKILIT